MSLYVVEARTPGGMLVKEPDRQPPFALASTRQLFTYYSDATGTPATSTHQVWDWFESRGWFIRERNW